jgi:DNA end-binding protein Ku
MAARSIGSGTISFGLVSIPFKTYTAASASRVSFNMLHAKCGGRLKQQYLCPTDNEIVTREDTKRGFEFSKDRYVLFTEEELKALESPRTGELELVQFVPFIAVDPVHFEKTYYLGPDKGGERAYRLLAESLLRSEKLAIGKYFTRGREQLVALRPIRSKNEIGLCLHELYYANEVRSFADVETAGAFTFKPIEIELADKLVQELASDTFRIESFFDSYEKRVREAVEQKAQGEAIEVQEHAPKAQIIDLLEALKRSLADVTQGKAGNDGGPAVATVSEVTEPQVESERPGIKKTSAKKPAAKKATGT